MLTKQIGEAELRTLEPWQAADFAAYVEANRAHLKPWLPWAESIVDEETARGFLQRYADRQAADEGRIYALWLGDRMVGGTLFRVFEPRQSLCEIGVWLSADVQGRGLVTQAAREMIAWAMDTRGIRRVEWHCVPDNAASIAVARRLGMTREGVLREAFGYGGRVHDVEIWALLARDRATRPA